METVEPSQLGKGFAVLFIAYSCFRAIETFWMEDVQWDMETRIEMTLKQLFFWWW